MKLMILDGNSIISRAYYGIRALNAPDGTPTNGVFGFLTILKKLLDEHKPDGICATFDLKAPTFRHKQYEAYKAQRKPMPEDLVVQMPIIKEVLDALGIMRLELEGYEADDIIGTVSKISEKNGDECLIVTGDKDSFQLITESSHVLHVKSRAGRTETIVYTSAVFIDEYGFEPKKIIDLKALMGDPSDNIPGVKGVGEKTATTLVQSYGGIDKIYADLATLDVKDNVRKKLAEGEAAAKMSYELATIVTDVPVEFKPSACRLPAQFDSAAYDVFRRLGFNTLIDKWGLTQSAQAESLSTPAMPLKSIANVMELNTLCEKWKALPAIAVLPVDGNLDAVEICDGEAVYTVRWTDCGDSYNSFLKDLFSEQFQKISHNIKDFMGLLLSENLDFAGFVFDTALAAYLIDSTESGYELSRISVKYLGEEKQNTEAAYKLMHVLKKRVESEGMTELYEKIELPLCSVLAQMEHKGFCVDRQALHEFGITLSKRIGELEKEIWELAGQEFNINSPKQLGEILFEKLMLPGSKKNKTGWSTKAEILESLHDKHPIIDKILEFRQLTKLNSTYAEGLIKAIGLDGRIHTSFQMTTTSTGRLSSTEPNLQNIPVRTQLGAQLRKMFVAENGNMLVDADYSQIELRLLAHISGDETMQNAFASGEDIHAVTASQVFGIPLSDVTDLQRRRAKAVNFGIVYGISAFSLARDIGVFTSEAKEYIDAYLSKYHGVREYMKNVVEEAKRNGHVTTLFGRNRPLPELKASNHNTRAFGERVALNTPIQGTAADIIKLAMVNVSKRLQDERLEAKLILQIHDELIVECPEAEMERVKTILTEEMENVVHYSVPLTVEAHIGKSWSDAK